MFKNFKPSGQLFVLIGTLLGACTPSKFVKDSHSTQMSQGSGVPIRAKFNSPGKYLIIEVLRDDIFHFELGLNEGPSEGLALETSPMVLKTDYPGPTKLSVEGETMETPALRARVNAETLCVTLFDKIKNIELTAVCPYAFNGNWGSGVTIDKAAMSNAYGLGNYFDYRRTAKSAEGDWIGNKWSGWLFTEGNARRSEPGGAPSVSQFPVLNVLGEGNLSYSLFFDHTRKYEADFSQDLWTFTSFGNTLRWYVITGPDLPDLRSDYMELVGKPRVPPRKAFGLWVSKFGYRSWDGVERAVASLEKDNFPVDGVALDLFWFGGRFLNDGNRNETTFDESRFGSLRFDEKAFPDPAGKIKSLLNRGIGIMPIEESLVANGKTMRSEFGDLMDELKDNAYVPRCAQGEPCLLSKNPWWGVGWYLDWTHAGARDFWHDNRRKYLTDLGVLGHWCDLGEPEVDQYVPNANYAGVSSELSKHNEIHNLYGFLWMQGIAEGYARNQTPARPFMLTRAGAPGIQRFGATMWSGDINSNHESLRGQINSQMHMSLAGIDYYSSDAGGFFGGNPGSDLYRMWLADNAMTDFPLRPHSWAAEDAEDKQSFAPNNAPTEIKNSNRATVQFKYELIPYHYALAHRAYRYGEPLTPPVFYYYQSDKNTRITASQKMSGRDLLFGLGTEPGQVRKDMYLPADAWYDYYSDVYMNTNVDNTPNMVGPFLAQRVDFDLFRSGLLRLPVYARGGSIIPIMKVDASTADAFGRKRQANGQLSGKSSEFVTRVFAGPHGVSSEFTVFEDDGSTSAYESGAVRTTRMTQVSEDRRTTVEVDPSVGEYEDAPRERNIEIWLTSPWRGRVEVSLDGIAMKAYASREDFERESAAGYFVDPYNGRIFAKLGLRPVSQGAKVIFSVL